MFIAHEQANTNTGFISPKGDKRCINPIIDKCDYVVYLKSNGVDENGNVIKSSGYLAATKDFFARARIEYTPTFLKEFTAESLTEAIQIGINKKKELEGATIVSFEEQRQLNAVEELNFEDLVAQFNAYVNKVMTRYETDPKAQYEVSSKITQIVENHLGKGEKVNQCSSNQAEAIKLILDDLKVIE